MKKVILTAIILLSMTSSVCAQGNLEGVEQPLKLTIEADKEVYSVGDEITVHWKVENVSNEVVTFYNDTLYFYITYGDEKRCPPVNIVSTLISSYLISLNPEESFDGSVKGKLVRGKAVKHTEQIDSSSEPRPIPGSWTTIQPNEGEDIFLVGAFGPGNVYLENGYGYYNIKTCYTGKSKRMAPRGVGYESDKTNWEGTINSNTITVEVVKKEEECPHPSELTSLDYIDGKAKGRKENKYPPMTTRHYIPCDLNFDGECDDNDEKLFETYLGECIDGNNYCRPCDADHDGCVTEEDREILFPPKNSK